MDEGSGMAIDLTVTAKGQITLQRAVLDHLGVASGDRVSVTLLPEGRVEIRSLSSRPPVSACRGILRRPGQPAVTIEDMQAAIMATASSPLMPDSGSALSGDSSPSASGRLQPDDGSPAPPLSRPG